MKSGRRGIYNLINLLVLALSAGLLFLTYTDPWKSLADVRLPKLAVIVLTVLLVHSVKALRLYLALYGRGVTKSACLKLYCKVTPVSVLIPWKLGEFFRIYCCGEELGSMLTGGVIILLDRFFDTVALVAMILMVWLFGGGILPPLVYALLIFLGLVLMLYFAFPGIYAVWKKYLLSVKATAHTLSMLKLLDGSNRVYQEIRGVLHGRGSLLFILSLAAWGVEIGSLYLLQAEGETLAGRVAQYLSAALGMGDSAELQRFVLFTILLLILSYAGCKLAVMLNGKRSES